MRLFINSENNAFSDFYKRLLNELISQPNKLFQNGNLLPILQVCQAEVDSQKLDTKLNLITAPFGEFHSFWLLSLLNLV